MKQFLKIRLVIFIFAGLLVSPSLVSSSPLNAQVIETALGKIGRIGPELSRPWGMDFLSDDAVIVTLRDGGLIYVNIKEQTHQRLDGAPQVWARGQGGLLDIVVSKRPPNLPDNLPYDIYICYAKPASNAGGSHRGASVAVAKYELAKTPSGDMRLSHGQDIFIANRPTDSTRHFGCRMVINDDMLYLSLGDRGQRNRAQDPKDHAGKLMKIDLHGLKNPVIHTSGHRNPQGMAFNPATGAIWLHEHGPRGGDEINLIQPDQNYGWPIVTHGREYIGGKIGQGTSLPGYADPLWVWTPSIAPSGMAFYDKNMFPELKGHLLVGSLKFQSLYLVRLENNRPVEDFVILQGEIGRIRDVAVGADGAIYLLSDESNGGLYRLSKT